MAHDAINPSDNTFATIALKNLRVWKGNPRRTIGDLSDLAASIKENGVIEPPIVRPVVPPEGDTTHEILAGQRRFLAAEMAGSLGLPCIVRDMDDAEARELGLVENSQREDPNPLEDAEAIDLRMRDPKRPCTVEYIADKLGRPVRWVQRRLSLLNLCDTAKSWMREGRLPLAHGMLLAAVDHSTQGRVIKRFEHGEIPPSKVFGREIIAALHVLSSAPFDVKAVKLPGGPCGKCPKRSDSQADLFEQTSADASCLDSACWDGKVAATWERAKASAEKRHLKVIEDCAGILTEDWGGSVSAAWTAPYVMKAPTDGAEPVAITRTPRGRVVELFARPAPTARVEPIGGQGGADDEEDESANEEARRAERVAQSVARTERERMITKRVVEVTETPQGLALVARVALYVFASEDNDAITAVRNALNATPFPVAMLRTVRDHVEAVPEEDLVRVLVAALASFWANDPDADDETPFERELRALIDSPAEQPATGAPTHRVLVIPGDADWIKLSKGLHGFSAEKTPGAGSVGGGSCRPLREVHTLMGHGDIEKLIARLDKAGVLYLDLGDVPRAAVFDLAPSNRSVRERWNAAHPARPVTLGEGEPGWAPVVASATAAEQAPVRVWITERVWDGLSEDDREALTNPDVDFEVQWDGREGFVTALVPAARIELVRTVAKARRVKFAEGDEMPVKRSKAVKS